MEGGKALGKVFSSIFDFVSFYIGTDVAVLSAW